MISRRGRVGGGVGQWDWRESERERERKRKKAGGDKGGISVEFVFADSLVLNEYAVARETR